MFALECTTGEFPTPYPVLARFQNDHGCGKAGTKWGEQTNLLNPVNIFTSAHNLVARYLRYFYVQLLIGEKRLRNKLLAEV